MKRLSLWGIMLFVFGCMSTQKPIEPMHQIQPLDNPLLRGFNAVIPFADLTADDIPEATDLTLAKAQKMLDGIIALKEGEHTFENTIVEIDNIWNVLGRVEYPVYLMGSVHPDAAVRDNADSSIIKFSEWETDMNLNEDLFHAVEMFANSPDATELSGEDFKLFDDIYKGFLRQGFGLPKETRDEIKKVRNELSKIGLEFNNNISNYNRHVGGYGRTNGWDTGLVQRSLPPWGWCTKLNISYPARRTFMQLSNDIDARKALSEKFLQPCCR